MSRATLSLFRRCLRAARRCPEQDQRLMMTYYTINSWRDGASLRDERAIRRQLADALDHVAAADGAPAADGDLSRASLGFVVSTHQRRFRGNCLDALRRPRPAVLTLYAAFADGDPDAQRAALADETSWPQ